MTSIRNYILALLLTTALLFSTSHMVFAGLLCGDIRDQLKTILGSGYAYLATATASNGLTVQFFINMKNGDWILLGIDSDMRTCQLVHGKEWQFAMVRGI